MESKPLVIYHHNCVDGFAAAWCYWHAYGFQADFHPGKYQETPPNVRGRRVVLVDFSYKSPVLAQMVQEAEHVTILDHHESAMKDVSAWVEAGQPKNLYVVFDMTRSGAMLAWDQLYPNTAPPPLITRIQDRDLWQFKYPDTKQVNAALFSYEYAFDVYDTLMAMPLETLRIQGESILRKQNKDLAELLPQVERSAVIAGWTVPIANLPYTLASEAGHALCVGAPFAAIYMDTAEYRVFSLRSRYPEEGSVNVSELATKFGGGGHPAAAGFKVERDHPLAKI